MPPLLLRRRPADRRRMRRGGRRRWTRGPRAAFVVASRSSSSADAGGSVGVGVAIHRLAWDGRIANFSSGLRARSVAFVDACCVIFVTPPPALRPLWPLPRMSACSSSEMVEQRHWQPRSCHRGRHRGGHRHLIVIGNFEFCMQGHCLRRSRTRNVVPRGTTL